jgi:hypothetical protein
VLGRHTLGELFCVTLGKQSKEENGIENPAHGSGGAECRAWASLRSLEVQGAVEWLAPMERTRWGSIGQGARALDKARITLRGPERRARRDNQQWPRRRGDGRFGVSIIRSIDLKSGEVTRTASQRSQRRSISATPAARFNPVWPCSETGCSSMVRFEPPMSTFAPTPATTLASALAPP